MGLVILTYLSGVLTILSPCILPVLPFVFSRSQGSFLKSTVPLLVGMSLTFSVFSILALAGGQWLARANDIGRILAMLFFTFFGLILIFPALSERLVAPLTQLGSKIGRTSKGDSVGGSVVIGISTGLLWAPCAGPILGLVLTGAAAQGHVGASVGLLVSYSLGAATSLAIALAAGNKFLGTLKKFLGVDQVVKKGLGIAVLLGVAMIALNLDRRLLTKISKFETTSLENKLLGLFGQENGNTIEGQTFDDSAESDAVGPKAADEGDMPDLTGALSWLNSPPLTKQDLVGKVVLIDFWTYSCINCLRTLPYVKAWAEKYKSDGLIVIGVHTPEFAFEKNLVNVQNAIKDLGVTYPVAIDSDYKIWNAYKNHYWPAHFFIDRQGKIRHHHFGEGQYEQSEKIIRELLSENGVPLQTATFPQSQETAATGVQAAGSVAGVSPETYVGYGRAENFSSSPELQEDAVAVYGKTKDVATNGWGLDGTWFVEQERAVLKKSLGRVFFRFHARDLHLVLGGTKKIDFKVTVDGHAPGEDHGADIDGQGRGRVQNHRLYQLIRQKNDENISDHLFEIEFSDPGVEVYAFTFG